MDRRTPIGWLEYRLSRLDKSDGADDHGCSSRTEARKMIEDGKTMLEEAEARFAKTERERADLEAAIALLLSHEQVSA